MSYNKITIIGNLGREPEMRYTPKGDAVCDFSVAVSDRKRDKQGDYQDVVTWFKVSFWRKQAENASKYLSKGSKVYVEGRLGVDEWADRDGNTRFTLTITGTEIQYLSEKPIEEKAESASANSFADSKAPHVLADLDDSSIPF